MKSATANECTQNAIANRQTSADTAHHNVITCSLTREVYQAGEERLPRRRSIPYGLADTITTRDHPMENHNPPLPNSQPINYSTGIAPEQTTARVFDTLEIAATVLSLIATGLMLWGNRFPRAEFAVGALSVLVWIIAIFIWLAAISHFLLFALNAPRFLPSPRKL